LNPQERRIGGFDETYLDGLDPNAPDFAEKLVEAVNRPVAEKKEDESKK
jgi:hypothetical protein